MNKKIWSFTHVSLVFVIIFDQQCMFVCVVYGWMGAGVAFIVRDFLIMCVCGGGGGGGWSGKRVWGVLLYC